MDLKSHWMADLLPQMPEKEFQDLKEDIAGLGQLEPILVFNGEIIDGRHRYRACQELGIEPWVQEFEGGMSLSDVIRSLNVYRRHLTASQRAMVAAELIKPYEEQAKQNQGERTDLKNNIKEILPECLPGPEQDVIDIPPDSTKQTQQATDMAAEDWGVSGRSVRDAKVIVQHGTDEEKESVKTGKSSVSSTAKQVREHIKKDKQDRPPAPKKMNFQDTGVIKWAKWTWNPVTGCLFGCYYCYARDNKMRFDGHFNPTIHRDRLDAPANTKIPDNKKDIEGIKNVFVCSTADLFGDWVDAEWIQSVIDVCVEQKQWTYLFLTKNPKRYHEFNFPKNCWLGASATNQEQYDRSIEQFRGLEYKNIHFLSFEPLNSEIATCDDFGTLIDLAIVGGRSRSTGAPAFQPNWEWVEHIFWAARAGGVAVYFKENLTVKPEEYPEHKV